MKEEMQHKEKNVSIFLKGVLMGSADIVPGVSGGTMALISGIYERLISAIASIGPKTLVTLRREGIASAWKSIDGTFLLTLGSGIVAAVLTVSHGVGWAIEHFPPVVWSFFFGLIVFSAYTLRENIREWKGNRYLALVCGIGIGIGVSLLTPATTPDALWFVALSGAIAISAMILPGISGSFLLLLMGKYAYMLNAIRTFDLLTIAAFCVGIVLGLMSGSRIVKVLFERFHDVTMATVIGIMLGSLYKVWPWKVAVTTYIDSDGIVQPITERAVLPAEYASMVGHSYVVVSIIALILGAIAIIFIQKYAKEKQK